MERKNIEDLYPLSPMQRGMMFHTLNQPGSGVYLEQIRLTLEPLDAATFQRAWKHMFQRFTALRTSIVGTGRKDPVQVIRRQVELPWAEHDCSEKSPDEQQAWIRSFLERDRLQDFQLSDPSLNRLTLVRLGEKRYEFIWSLHHIVLDGWSGAMVLRDLLQAYESIDQGLSPHLPPVPPFREYISWLRGQDTSGAEAYWKRMLQGFTVPTPIGGDRRDSIHRDVSSYDEHSIRLSPELTAALRTTAAAGQVTVNTLLQGAWALLLSRNANEEDVVFGTVVSGRPEPLDGVDRMVGMFVNTLPLRVRVDGSESTRTWLQTLQRDQTECRRYEHSPLWDIQRWSDVPAGVPLFETLFVFENYRVDGSTSAGPGGLKVDVTPPFDRTGFPLMLLVQPSQQLQLRMTYDADRFERSTIERMISDLERLLQRITADGDAPLSQLTVLDEPQRQRILVDWNRTERAFPTDQCMHHLFETQVDQRPQALAVEIGSEQLTYRALEGRANRLAHHLQELGVGPDVPVGICVERSLDMVVGVLGILKAGGAYVPLDPGYPPERLSYMLGDAALPVVLTHDAAAGALPDLATLPTRPTVVRLDRDAAVIAARPATRPASSVTPDDLLYVLYTSGSTGRPKGVAMPHAPLVNLMHWQLDASNVGAGERTLQFAPFSFDVSCQEIFATLAAGGTLCLIDETLRRDPEALLQLLHERSVARVFMPFVALQQLAEVADRTDQVPRGLREVITAGEQLQVTPALIRLFQALGDCTLCNQYGPTECHVVSSFTCTGPPEQWPTLPPIGRPIANTRLYLLDRSGEPVPVGVPGELFIGGRAVARGYLNDEALTAERFTRDPHCEGRDERRYRTGDLGRYLPDGNIEFLGRADHQVKLRGYRVEPGEVESVLQEHPAVRQAAAVVREDRPGDRRLIGYVVADDAGPPDQDQLRSFTSTRLPEYMVPSAFVRLPSLPLTPSGKIDRRALLAERFAPLEQRAAYVAPRDGVEEVLASIWTDVLGVAAPGVHDDFFELGGHSLMVTQLVSRIRDALQTELALREVFDHPTIATLRKLVNRDTDRSDPAPLTAAPRDGHLLLSFAQQRLWFLDQLGSGAAYNMPWAFRLRGALDASVLEESLNTIVARHEALRTSFPAVNGTAVQHIRPTLRVPVRTIDLSSHAEASREEEAQRLYEVEALKPFDLAEGPVLRVTLVRLADEEHLLFLSIHHIVFDGWSIGVFNHELFALYRELSDGGGSPLPELPVQYADFSTWQTDWLQGEVVDQQLAYWREKLDGLERLDLPTDRPRPAVMTYRGGAARFDLPPELARSLRLLSQRRGVTLAMTMMAAFKVLLARWSGQPDIAVGSPIANRTRSEIENLIGFFVNSLVLRTDLSGEPSFVEVLQRVQRTALEAYDHQDLPFERLVDELQPERDQSRNPLFQVVFALQNAPRQPLQLPGMNVEPFQGRAVATRFDLELHLQDSPAGVGGGFCFNTDLFDQETIERLATRFRLLLEAIVVEPDTPIGQLNPLPEDERRQLEQWNHPSAAPTVAECLHERFERQAQRTPDRVAVVCEQQRLTYAQLNRRANQLAHHLRALGVGPEVLVGLSLDRNLDLVVGILGILKAGGGYVPLDLSNPRERIAFILRDTRVGVLVTESSQLDTLPDHDAKVVCLDTDRSAIEAERCENPDCGATPDNVAYVIYTSGSTGTPKGVLVEHRTVGRLFTATEAWYRFDGDDVWTLFHSSAFDFSVWEMWGALLYGGRLVVVPYWVTRSPEDFYKLLAREQVTVLNQTPSAFRQLMRADEALGHDHRLALRQIIFGGEALELQSLEPWFDRHGDQRPQLVNMYGITETSVHVTYRPLSRRDLKAAPGSVIGRPIPDLQVYILDEHRQLVPIGVPGEMYVGGAGVARGYLDRPELTAERFIADPFRAEPDARLYRTGDVGRYLVNGDIEYLGRNDEQVKIRGYRIELGEIESALSAHPWVRESVVTVREEGATERRLVGYLVPDEAGARAEEETLIAQWQSLYDSTYGGRDGADDPTFNIIGWNNSYTGEPIPAEQMRNWLNETVARIRRGNPRRVLEIGCGTGLLLFRVAPHCDSYVATDFSQVALDHIEGHLDRIDGLESKVQLHRRLADHFEGLEPESFDTVVLNSVIQYFPSIDYLLQVIQGAVACAAPGGRVYIGDVRDLRLLEAYHAAVQLHQADDELTVDELQQRVRQRLTQEEELVVDPAFFLALREHLPRVSAVSIEPKRSRDLNELTKFRYEVTLHVESDQTNESCPWLDWGADRLTVQSVRERLEHEPEAGFGIHAVPNSRTIMDTAAAHALLQGTKGTVVGALKRDLARQFAGAGIDPAELLALEETVPHHIAVSCASRREGSVFDVRCIPRDRSAPGAAFPSPRLDPRPWASYANHPLQAKMTRQLAPQLRESLERTLPKYMVPSAFVMLQSLPLTSNGKVDRRRLPEPEWYLNQRRGTYVAPRTSTQRQVAQIWSELLGVVSVGLEDNFFDLGGHSLLATQVVSRAREKFSVELEVRQLFDTPTVAGLSESIEGLTWVAQGPRDPEAVIDGASREGGVL